MHAAQLLAYFAVAKQGDEPSGGRTEENPEGLTAVTGKWADAVAQRLKAAGVAVKVGPDCSRRHTHVLSCMD